MNTYKKILLPVMTGVLMMSAMAGCQSVPASTEDATDVTESGINVSVSRAEMRSVESSVNYTGELIAEDIAYVTSKVSAKIESVNANIGDWVEKGEILLYLDDTDYAMQLESAKAGYRQAEAAYESAKAACANVDGVNAQSEAQLMQAVKMSEINYNDAKANLDRQTELYNKGSISLVAYEGAKSAYESASVALSSAKTNYDIAVNTLAPGNKKSAEGSVVTAEAAKNSASVAIKQCETMIANTVVRAPISGYISSKNAAVGQFVSPGIALFTIADTQNLQVEIKVTEAVVPYIEKGGRSEINVMSVNKTAEGTISLVNPVKDAQSGMYMVRIDVPNKDNSFKSGMFADCRVITNRSESEILAIPSEAVIQSKDGSYVYVVKGNAAEKKYITCSVSDGEYTAVTEGIEEGDIVVCEGKEYISEENNIVNIVE